MNILICDDEYQYIKEIKTIAEGFFEENFRQVFFDEFTDGQAALESELKRYDIAFLDIEIGDVKGTQIAEKIKSLNPRVLIFFITAFDHYLDDAMDHFAFRFLTKPLDAKRMIDGLEKAVKIIDSEILEILVKDKDSVCRVYSSDIILVEIKGRSTMVVTSEGTFMSSNKIDFWQEKLSSSNFFRVHRSYIVNIDHITKYTRDNLVMDNGNIIPIAYRSRAPFRKILLQKIEEL